MMKVAVLLDECINHDAFGARAKAAGVGVAPGIDVDRLILRASILVLLLLRPSGAARIANRVT